MIRQTRQAGFTLVEMTITMVLLGIVGLMLTNFIVGWLQTSSRAQAQTALLETAQDTLDTIAEDIRLSGNADDNNRWPDSNLAGNQFTWQSDADTLVLAKASTDSDNDIIFSDPARYISEKHNVIFYLQGSALYRRIITSNHPADQATSTCTTATAACPKDRRMATNVSAFQAVYYNAEDDIVGPADARSVQLSITLNAKKSNQNVTANYTTRMVFRNE